MTIHKNRSSLRLALAATAFAVFSTGSCGPRPPSVDDDGDEDAGGSGAASTTGSGGGSIGTMSTGGSPTNSGGGPSAGGASGSGPASGGAGNGGSTPGTGGTAPTGSAAVITDLETGTHYFDDKTAGLVGAWFSYGDATAGAMSTPAAGTTFKPKSPGHASMYAACLGGSGFTTWGAGMGFNLNDPGDGKGGSAVAPFDAGVYGGFSFWAKATTALTVKLKVPTKSTDPAGNVCMGTTGDTACYNHPVKEILLGTEWEAYQVSWAELLQEPGWGLPAELKPAELFGVRIEVGSDAGTFEFCVDDVAFTK